VNGGGVDQLIALLKQAHSESLDVSGFEYAPREDYLLEIRILENFAASGAKSLDTHVPWGRKTRSIRSIVVSTIASDLVTALCIARDKNGHAFKQEMTHSPLVAYLYDRSPWIERLFSFEDPAEGGALEFPIGESSELLTETQTKRLLDELLKIPRPAESEDLLREYDHAVETVRSSLRGKGTALILAVL
jgi:hypothetical protein